MKKTFTAILLFLSVYSSAQKEATTALKKFWKLTSVSESKGKWTSKLEGSSANTYMHFRDGGVFVLVEDGDADKASWRYDESTKKLQVTFKGADEDYQQDYRLISVAETQLELEATDEDGNKTGMRFSPSPYPFFPRLPAFLADLLYNLDIPFTEAHNMLKQGEFTVEKTETSGGIKISHYDASRMKIVVYSKGNDVTGFLTDIASEAYRTMRAELKQKGYTESYDGSRARLSFKNSNYEITFYNVYENGLPNMDVKVAIYDLRQMSVN